MELLYLYIPSSAQMKIMCLETDTVVRHRKMSLRNQLDSNNFFLHKNLITHPQPCFDLRFSKLP